jgi:hypothetical protein
MRALAAASFVLCFSVPGVARAQTAADGWAPPPVASRPTSGAASILSGRTLGTGETVIAASLGWPGLWAQVELAPDSNFNIGIRAGVLYGSPVMGLVAGAGGEVQVPFRIHLWGQDDVDLALRIVPEIALGEGRLFGEDQSPVLRSRLGISTRLDAGIVFGFRYVDVTFVAGASGGAGISWTENSIVRAIGVVYAILGIEALMSRETMLFADIHVGGGFGDGSGRAVAYYPQQEILRIALGIAYLL